MSRMFSKCSSLVELNIENFNTLNANYMYKIFSGNLSLQEINMLNFDTQRAANMDDMFNGCVSLRPQKIICKRNVIKSVNYMNNKNI